MEMKTVGIIIMSAIAIIVAISLLTGGGISTSVGEMVSTRNVYNHTYPVSAVTSTVTLTGRAVTNMVISNYTDGVVYNTGNYTTSDNVILSDGTLGAQLKGTAKTNINGTSINASYTYQPLGYVAESGGRVIAGIIILFCAIAILIVAIVPTLQNIKMFGG